MEILTNTNKLMTLKLLRIVLYFLLLVSLYLPDIFKHQFKLSDLFPCIDIVLPDNKHKTDIQLFSSRMRLTSLLSTRLSGDSPSPLEQTREWWLLVAKSINKVKSRKKLFIYRFFARLSSNTQSR